MRLTSVNLMTLTRLQDAPFQFRQPVLSDSRLLESLRRAHDGDGYNPYFNWHTG
jgi:hypothetical protein